MRTSLLPTRNRRIIFSCIPTPFSYPTRTIPRMSTGVPSQTAQAQKSAEMSTTSSSDLGIESTVNIATGVSLSSQQKLIVGSVLDVGPYSPRFPEHKTTDHQSVIRRQADPQKTPALDRRCHVRGPAHQSRRPQAIRSTMVRPQSRLLRDRATVAIRNLGWKSNHHGPKD